MYRCNLCPPENPYRVPAGDHIGVALMKQHLVDEHDIPAWKLGLR